MPSRGGTSQPKTAKGRATAPSNSNQQTNSPVQSGLSTVFNGVTQAIASSASSATSSTPPNQGSSSNKSMTETLKEKLPVFPSGKGSNFKDPTFHTVTKPKGKSTSTAKPPIAWDPDDMESFYKTHFTDEIAKINAPGGLPQLEKSFRMSNEGDVVRASAVYLVNLVNIAAQAWLENKYGDKYILKCVAEDSKTEDLKTRTDLEWRLETPADAKLNAPTELRRVAIMEYKRKHLINPNELLKAKYDLGKDRARFERNAAEFEGEKTYFAGPTFWVIKQAKGYQTNRKVNDVCLFDWDTIFILDFQGESSQGGPTPEESDADNEPWPAGMLYQEQGGAAAAAEYTFRSLLLAFLIRALKRVTGQPIPGEPSDSNPHDEKPPTSSHGNTAESSGRETNLTIRPKPGGEDTGESQQGGQGRGESGARGRRGGGVSPGTSGRGGGTSPGTSGRGGGTSPGTSGRGGGTSLGASGRGGGTSAGTAARGGAKAPNG